MNDNLFYKSSQFDDMEELYKITSFKTNYMYLVHNGIEIRWNSYETEYGTPFELLVVDQAKTTSIFVFTALMAGLVALF